MKVDSKIMARINVGPGVIDRWKYGKLTPHPEESENTEESENEHQVPKGFGTKDDPHHGKLAWYIPPLTRHLTCVGKRVFEERVRHKVTVSIVGGPHTGRSTLVHRFFQDEALSTPVADFENEDKLVYMNGEIVQMTIRTHRRQVKSDGYVYLYDITNPKSLDYVISEKKAIGMGAGGSHPCVLAGAKADCADSSRHAEKYDGRHVPPERAIAIAMNWNCCFYELDCLDLKSPVDDVFYQVLNSIVQRKQDHGSPRRWCLSCSCHQAD